MSLKWLKRTALIVTMALVVLLIAPASSVFAAARQYTALGDSISYGLTDLSKAGGYVGMYATWLPGYSSTNLSWPGDTTQDLLDTIAANESLIRRSNVLTVSIGSNNLLGPVIASILGLYHIDPNNYPHDLNGELMLKELYMRIHMDWADGDAITPAHRLARLIYPVYQEYYELNAALTAGTAAFALHWPVILMRIRLRAPLAKLYVNNLYNPLLMSKTYDKGIGIKYLYDSMDLYMGRINANITRYASCYRYKVVDVYGPFTNPANYDSYGTNPFTAPLTFNIPAALQIASGALPAYPYGDIESFQAFFFACDPHPTTVGHTIIFNALKALS